MGLELEEKTEEVNLVDAFRVVVGTLIPLNEADRKRVLKAAVTLLDVDLEY